MQIRKSSKYAPMVEFAPWTPAHFQTKEIRDRFLLRVAATLSLNDIEVKPMHRDGRGALVRWRQGQFSSLNDLAHAHAGRIVVDASRSRYSYFSQ